MVVEKKQPKTSQEPPIIAVKNAKAPNKNVSLWKFFMGLAGQRSDHPDNVQQI